MNIGLNRVRSRRKSSFTLVIALATLLSTSLLTPDARASEDEDEVEYIDRVDRDVRLNNLESEILVDGFLVLSKQLNMLAECLSEYYDIDFIISGKTNQVLQYLRTKFVPIDEFMILIRHCLYPHFSLKVDRGSSDSMYSFVGKVNGFEVLFVVDTGATLVALSQQLADDLGLKVGKSVEFSTAGGPSTGHLSEVHKLSLGPRALTFKNIAVSVMPNMDGPVLLGQAVLKRLQLHTVDHMLFLQHKDFTSHGQHASKYFRVMLALSHMLHQECGVDFTEEVDNKVASCFSKYGKNLDTIRDALDDKYFAVVSALGLSNL